MNKNLQEISIAEKEEESKTVKAIFRDILNIYGQNCADYFTNENLQNEDSFRIIHDSIYQFRTLVTLLQFILDNLSN